MAYTKYSLTPANNTAAPPDGAPEGMLPSAVNDTMRDMMAQIRDCGDGIRDGTYTMTAPKITGGTITGSTINNSAIGGTTAAAGAFTTLSASGVATFSAGTVSLPAITTTGDTNTGIFFPAADTIAFTEGGVEAMRIDSNGNLGLGITPQVWYLNSSVYGAFQFGAGALLYGRTAASSVNLELTTNSYLDTSAAYRYLFNGEASKYAQASGAHIWYSAASGTAGNSFSYSERMRINSSGNVGIGTASPKSVGNYTFVTTNATTGSGYSVQVNGTEASNFYANSGATVIQEVRALPLVFETNATERMRITSGGSLVVGTTDTNNSSGAGLKLNNEVANSAYFSTVLNVASGVNGYLLYNTNATNNGYRFYVNVNGGIYNYSGNNSNLSDERTKKNIELAGDYLNKICSIPVKTFNYKDEIANEQKTLGVIAQDVEAVAPELVNNEGFGETKEGEEPLKSIYTTDMMFAMMKAIQEQQAMIEELKQEVALLKSK